MEERTTRAGTPERRNHAPTGRLRRIFFDYHAPTAALLATVLLAAALFVLTAARAVDARFERDVAEIAYTHDSRSLRFLEERAARRAEATAARVDSLDAATAAAETHRAKPYLVASIEEKRVWYVEGDDTLFSAPIAVGSGKTLVMGGQTQRFQTPRGHMKITHKERDAVWVPPDWHYYQVAKKQGLRVVDMSNAPRDALARFPAGKDPIEGGKIYIPPIGSPQRRDQGVLGAAKLEMRDGYYFHGTNNEASIGTAASAGCIRLRKDDILWMYEHVPVGTDVYIY
jgi:lipoprotein-anchoring transpeptidase ErfK/SrfK